MDELFIGTNGARSMEFLLATSKNTISQSTFAVYNSPIGQQPYYTNNKFVLAFYMHQSMLPHMQSDWI